MNDRIKELAIQAGAGEWGDSVVPAMMDIAKFAESIVKECAKLLEEMPRYYKQESDRQIERDTIFDCVRTIKDHFGVAE